MKEIRLGVGVIDVLTWVLYACGCYGCPYLSAVCLWVLGVLWVPLDLCQVFWAFLFDAVIPVCTMLIVFRGRA